MQKRFVDHISFRLVETAQGDRPLEMGRGKIPTVNDSTIPSKVMAAYDVETPRPLGRIYGWNHHSSGDSSGELRQLPSSGT